MILTSTSRFFVVHGVDSGQGHFTDSLVVSKFSRPTTVLTNQAYLENGNSRVYVCAALLSSDRLLHAQEDLMFHTEEKHHTPDLVANLH